MTVAARSSLRITMLLRVFCLLFLLGMVSPHGHLKSPASRSSMWRYGWETPKNYDDNQLFCGGKTHQWDVMKGKCGICGDAYDDYPRQNEWPGQYANGIIAAKYTAGEVIRVDVDITANHGGFFEFRLCPLKPHMMEATQSCLDALVLQQPDGSRRFHIDQKLRAKVFTVPLRLPKSVTCDRCVMQWKWNTGNSWGCELDPVTGNKTCCVGCGEQEQFINCADVKITGSSGQAKDNNLSPSSVLGWTDRGRSKGWRPVSLDPVSGAGRQRQSQQQQPQNQHQHQHQHQQLPQQQQEGQHQHQQLPQQRHQHQQLPLQQKQGEHQHQQLPPQQRQGQHQHQHLPQQRQQQQHQQLPQQRQHQHQHLPQQQQHQHQHQQLPQQRQHQHQQLPHQHQKLPQQQLQHFPQHQQRQEQKQPQETRQQQQQQQTQQPQPQQPEQELRLQTQQHRRHQKQHIPNAVPKWMPLLGSARVPFKSLRFNPLPVAHAQTVRPVEEKPSAPVPPSSGTPPSEFVIASSLVKPTDPVQKSVLVPRAPPSGFLPSRWNPGASFVISHLPPSQLGSLMQKIASPPCVPRFPMYTTFPCSEHCVPLRQSCVRRSSRHDPEGACSWICRV